MIAAAQAFTAKHYAGGRHALESPVQKNRDANLYAVLGNMNPLSGDLPSAGAAFLRSEQLDPSFAYGHVRLAEIYYRAEQGSQMKEEAKKVLRLQPNDAAARRYLASPSPWNRRIPAPPIARTSMICTTSRRGENTEANDLSNQAMALYRQHKSGTKAEASYRRAIEIDPQSRRVLLQPRHSLSWPKPWLPGI
ncbi:MAG TPA: hypothetical protein VIX14_04075 [Terriglobales bacterium]